ncbi:MAG: hypothetical protein JWL59_3436 [Chthoniobacteraceae bacterium]|nr:hypothetical protein [Chthoniobacteraceae bacterium]
MISERISAKNVLIPVDYREASPLKGKRIAAIACRFFSASIAMWRRAARFSATQTFPNLALVFLDGHTSAAHSRSPNNHAPLGQSIGLDSGDSFASRIACRAKADLGLIRVARQRNRLACLPKRTGFQESNRAENPIRFEGVRMRLSVELQ